ncbi:fructosamine kinase family protein [Thalassospira sp. MA62]|nr:fructosamine kinase family protein [Thalassospira sp. MA62]
MPSQNLDDQINQVTGATITRQSAVSGGCVADVRKLDLDNGMSLIAKLGARADLEIEGEMLRYFAQKSPIPCPDVLFASHDCLIMSFIPSDGHMTVSAQHDLATQLAQQHQVHDDQFGLSFDTLIGGLHQPNPRTQSWVTFFGEYRLRQLAHNANQAGRLPANITARMDRLIERLGDMIDDCPAPSLLHGDLWGGNILCRDGKIAALIDPAIYYGDREIELAFGTLFGDLTPDFFEQYHSVYPISPGFLEERRDLYNLYPLLVHVRLFGGSYVRSVDHILGKLGF